MFKSIFFHLILFFSLILNISCGKISEGEETKNEESTKEKVRVPHQAILDASHPCNGQQCELIELNDETIMTELEKIKTALINSGNKTKKSYPFLTVSTVLMKKNSSQFAAELPSVCLMENKMIRTLESFNHDLTTNVISYSIKHQVAAAGLLSKDPNCQVLNKYIKDSIGAEYFDNLQINLDEVFPRSQNLLNSKKEVREEAFAFNKIIIKNKEYLQIKTVSLGDEEFCFFSPTSGNFCELFKNVSFNESVWLSYGNDNLTPQIYYSSKEALIKNKLINFSIIKKLDF
jgi:hypothetical protein